MEAPRLILLDTSVLIDYFRRKNKAKTLFLQLNEEFQCCLSVISDYEFRNGITPVNQTFIETLLDNLPKLDFTEKCALQATIIYKKLVKENLLIPHNDIMIAATALVHKIPLATFNIKHFERIKQLKIYSIYSK